MTPTTQRGADGESAHPAGAVRQRSPTSNELARLLEHEAALEARVEEAREHAKESLQRAEREVEQLEEASRHDLQRDVEELDDELDGALRRRLEELEARAGEAVERYQDVTEEEIARLAGLAVDALFSQPGSGRP